MAMTPRVAFVVAAVTLMAAAVVFIGSEPELEDSPNRNLALNFFARRRQTALRAQGIRSSFASAVRPSSQPARVCGLSRSRTDRFPRFLTRSACKPSSSGVPAKRSK
jgi:hypothetical protein